MLRSLTRTAGVLAVLVTAGISCDSDDAPDPIGPETTMVIVAYVAPTITDPNIAASFPVCVNGVDRTHIHPSWRNFGRFDMTAATGVRWEIVLSDVPVNQELRIRINDPNACDTDPNGATTDNVFANGVELTRVVTTPGNGSEPGLAFTVAADGEVTP
ncbi:MAG TPA: hypothetical protein VJ596_04775 [Gemmatimonadaceae bacterium]|nr:hypothetical protein [Gemmatimonadaceae bacterium]